MAQALNSLFKVECIRNPTMRPKGDWKSMVDVEIAVAEYVVHHRRLIGRVPPAEFEVNHRVQFTLEHYPVTGDGFEVGQAPRFHDARVGATAKP